jgi:hypothetical protein
MMTMPAMAATDDGGGGDDARRKGCLWIGAWSITKETSMMISLGFLFKMSFNLCNISSILMLIFFIFKFN